MNQHWVTTSVNITLSPVMDILEHSEASHYVSTPLTHPFLRESCSDIWRLNEAGRFFVCRSDLFCPPVLIDRLVLIFSRLKLILFVVFELPSISRLLTDMAENRATKSGLAAEAHNKIQSKYDPALASEVLKWMQNVMGESENIDTSGDRETFYKQLKDGQVLCRLINVLQPGSIPEKKINNTTMAFKCMENINLFLEQVKKLGVPAEETFQTVDLWEQQNLTSVLICLQSLARKASKFGFQSIGPKEAEANVRQFSEEQLKAGAGVISLQYGSNKGANQSGINFGNTRHM